MKYKLKDSIKSVLRCVEDLSLENGAKVMYHFLNGILVGGTIDLEKEVMEVQEKDIMDFIKESSIKKEEKNSI